MSRTKSQSSFADALAPVIKDVWGLVKEDMVKTLLSKVKKVAYETQKRFSGEIIAVLGPPAAGKTTLICVLKNPLISAEELRTYHKTEVESVEAFVVDYKFSVGNGEQVPFKFRLKKNTDVGGEEYIRDQHWVDTVNGAAVVIYMIDSVAFLAEDSSGYKQRILLDFSWLLEQVQLLDKKFEIVPAFNKIDELCDKKGYRKFVDEFLPSIREFHEEIVESWPEELAKHIKQGTFLSLRDPGLRAFTLNALVGQFVGADLLKIYRGD